ncbi:predicted protein [Nematostella vectensis]|uniref:BD-FAE-like domain-containing protein n=1 Tax=Nematostella vectensis TaxID=45351 RepID=A7SYB9_NEMVE|nr:predicted protein [Nematostella vectensis]|eukprot:XP_001623412.1 predicted protein [Nematostella vectensis]
MEEQYEVKKDIEYYVKSRDDECCSQENSISKNTLDLFLPLHSDSSTPIVVFVHGGGWMRGDKQAYRHYFSCYDTNLLVALLFSYYDGYANVGKSFARAGIACAVISYRLSRLEFPWLLLELTMSLLMSLTVLLTPLVFVAFVAGIVSNVLHRTEDNFNFTAQSGSILSYCTLLLLFSLFILWFIVCQNGDGYFIPPQAKFYPLILSLVVSTACLLVLDIELVSFASCLTICMVLFLLHSFAMFQRSCRPIVRHPSHINDVARSVAWVVGYGNATKRYNQEQVFLCGHSAGGHLVSLLALDSNYLENVGVPLSNIKTFLILDYHKQISS